MTTQTKDQQAEAKLLWLAELTVECLTCKGVGGWVQGYPQEAPPCEQQPEDVTCHKCQGTGQVAKYKMLRHACPCLDLVKNCCDGCTPHLRDDRFGKWHGDWCDCKDLKWLSVSREKAGTEIRKMERFREWVLSQASNDFSSRLWLIELIALLCDDNACIMALWKMEEGQCKI